MTNSFQTHIALLGTSALSGNLPATAQVLKTLTANFTKKQCQRPLNLTLLVAATTPHDKIVQALINAGASASGKDNQPLHTALSYGHVEVAQCLYKNGAIPKKKEPDPVHTAAASANHTNAVNRLACVRLALDIHVPTPRDYDYLEPQAQLAQLADIASLEAIRTHPRRTYTPERITDGWILTMLYQNAKPMFVTALTRFGLTFQPDAIRDLLPILDESDITTAVLTITKRNFRDEEPYKIAAEAANKAAASIWLGHQLAP